MQGGCEELLVQVEVHDVEEGEISDSASVEEITKDDFNAKQGSSSPSHLKSTDNPKKTNAISDNRSQNSGGGTRSGNSGWTMRDVYKYQIAPRSYNSGLYNLAWAQAVNNKPLDEVFVMMDGASTNTNNDAKSDTLSSANKVAIDVEDDGEKEEGELEEGEIDLDSESVFEDEVSEMELEEEVKADGRDHFERKKQIDLIKKELKSLIFTDADKSFAILCSSLQNSVDGFQKLVLESSITEKDDLAEQLYNAIESVKTVFFSMNQRLKEQNRDILSRFLIHVTSLKPPLFSLQRLKEIEVIISSVNSLGFSCNNDIDSKKKRVDVAICKTDADVLFQKANNGLTGLNKDEMLFRTTGSLDQTHSNFSSDDLKSGLDNHKHKGPVRPLLDLHVDYDAENLPSPTRVMTSSLPFGKGLLLGHGSVKPEWPVPRQFLRKENAIMHPYETDGVKAVSSYQQKFGHSSFFRNDELPSPTPSEQGDTGNGETSGEVSSSVIQNVSNVNTSMLGQQMSGTVKTSKGHPIVSSSASVALTGQGMSNALTTGLANTTSNPVLKSSSARIRDPRLRRVNSNAVVTNDEPRVEPLLGLTSSQKQKIVEDLVSSGPMLKRQRNESTVSGIAYNAQGVSETGGWLEDKGTVGTQGTRGNHILGSVGNSSNLENVRTGVSTSSITTNLTIKGNEKVQIVGQNTTLSLPSSATSLPTLGANSTSLLTCLTSSLPLSRPVKLPLPNQTTNFQVTDPSATPSLQSLLRDLAVNPAIFMNILKSEQKSFDYNKSTTHVPISDSLLGSISSTNGVPPNVAVLGQPSAGNQTPSQEEDSGKIRMKPRDPRRVHYNVHQKGGSTGSDQLKINTSTGSAMTGNLGSTQRKEDQLEKKSVPSSSVMQPDITRQFTNSLKNIADILSLSKASVSPSIPPVVPTSQSLAVDKVGTENKSQDLVSDNLKNGASFASEEPTVVPPRPPIAWSDVEHLFDRFDDQQKFVEVDPHHEDMLRKKEEEDREKPQRHLFRFPHMGMWTKLRPGIWNFLEKASKLFELHLYTMGNKYYATEMAKLLDPKGELFSGRVISRGDDGDPFDSEDRVPKTKDLDGVLGMESAVVIVDDSVRVWPHNKLNLIVVERYIYFPCSRRQFGLPGPSLLEIDHDERPEFGTLASSLAVIERIHHTFFAHQSLDEADVRNILASEQRKILAGCRVVFSRIFPVGEANPHMHPLWQTAEQFGAVCTNQIDEQVTHVVANSLGTDKVNWALSKGRFVVYPGCRLGTGYPLDHREMSKNILRTTIAGNTTEEKVSSQHSHQLTSGRIGRQ
ncbi:RNA polymerase II C-terminal domain phosphatase-like 3 [Dorcoceras hygrometricum]|uniref:protein-serine/threonine phosphatase n=1 Tax=Dorcoceras hygrometricum TaxID=472368 RepID=A0A2Z7CM77_9LAMI|nr:RNA polymerase II C-terminal domain phosphatase-like 3 [Dorcoceras hygrometricum]